MKSDPQIGVRMKEERTRLGMSQQAIADAIGISREMWAKYEAGAEPGAHVLSQAQAVNVDVLYVLTGQRSVVTPVLTQREEALLDNYRNSPDAGRDALERTASALAQSQVKPKRKAG